MNVKFIDAQLDETSNFLLVFTRVFGFLGLIAASIACLGLLGMAVFNAETRTKEIGIRKVVGASIFTILKLLSKGFSKMVILACLLAFPVAWYAMDNWLNDFAYRIILTPTVFLLSGGLILLVTWLTVGYQSLRAARVNPIVHIKSE